MSVSTIIVGGQEEALQRFHFGIALFAMLQISGALSARYTIFDEHLPLAIELARRCGVSLDRMRLSGEKSDHHYYRLVGPLPGRRSA